MASQRREQLGFGELVIKLIGLLFLMGLMFAMLPGGMGSSNYLKGMVGLAILVFGALAIFAAGFGIYKVFTRPKSNATTAALTSTSEQAAPVAIPKYESAVFLSAAERSYFGVLQKSIPENCLIFAKVRLADIIHPTSCSNRSAWQSAFNRISGKHIDFVLCDSSRIGVLAAIELDDRSHETFEAGFRDDLVDTALESAGIKILRIPARASYSPAQLRSHIDRLLHPPIVKIAAAA